MADNSGSAEQRIAIELDAATFAALQRSAGERELTPAALVERWVRERLAHEAERGRGRARQQRPGE